jgi:hypothetical protein
MRSKLATNIRDGSRRKEVEPMTSVRVELARFVDDWQPGFVECELVDATGRRWIFCEKAPIVSSAALDSKSSYPTPGLIACTVLADFRGTAGRRPLRISTDEPWHVEATDGSTIFEVLAEQVEGW